MLSDSSLMRDSTGLRHLSGDKIPGVCDVSRNTPDSSVCWGRTALSGKYISNSNGQWFGGKFVTKFIHHLPNAWQKRFFFIVRVELVSKLFLKAGKSWISNCWGGASSGQWSIGNFVEPVEMDIFSAGPELSLLDLVFGAFAYFSCDWLRNFCDILLAAWFAKRTGWEVVHFSETCSYSHWHQLLTFLLLHLIWTLLRLWRQPLWLASARIIRD